MIAQAQPKYLIPLSRSKQDLSHHLSCPNLAKHSTEVGLGQEGAAQALLSFFSTKIKRHGVKLAVSCTVMTV